MFTTLRENRKVTSLLGALLVIVGSHFILTYRYTDSYDYAAKNYQDADVAFYAYEMTLLAILGEIGILSCRSPILRALFSLLLLPNVLFLTFMLKVYSLNQGDTFIALATYHDYLFWFPFFVDGLLLLIGMHIIGIFFKR
jgi:hypothetical protein